MVQSIGISVLVALVLAVFAKIPLTREELEAKRIAAKKEYNKGRKYPLEEPANWCWRCKKKVHRPTCTSKGEAKICRNKNPKKL